MKTILSIATTTAAWIMLGSSVSAMCIWFAPPGRNFEPASSIQTLVVEDEGTQTLIVQPQWSGNATDFGLVMPFPTKPELSEVSESIFQELEDLTNPEIVFEDFIRLPQAGTAADIEQGVTVIDERDIGDYTAATLSADSADALDTWLQENGYESTNAKRDILNDYIDGDASFFVALKVNVGAVNLDERGDIRGELNPLSFTFQKDGIQLPLRLMAGEEGRVDLVVYTLSDNEWFIPGAEIQFARKLTANDLTSAESLVDFKPRGKWLVRNAIQFNPAAVSTDIELQIASQDVIVENGATKRINPDALDSETGLIEADRGELVYILATTEQKPLQSLQPEEEADIDQPVLYGIIVVLGVSNLFLLNKVLGKRKLQRSNEL